MDKLKFIRERYSEKYNEKKFLESPIIKRMLELCKLIGGKNILDIGCGDGTFGKVLKEKYGKKVYGVDLSKEALKIAKARGIDCQYCDVERGLPYNDNIFDAVIAGEIIEHIYDTDYFLEEIRRVLVSGAS